MAKKHPGTCALCGKQVNNLTFEHIPPKASFNSSPTKPINMMDWIKDDDRFPWETEGLPYQNQQQGMGMNSLCRDCNTFTGTSYGRAYADVARTIHRALQEMKPGCTGFELDGVYPQRFIKQVISMFCSLNPQRSKKMEQLRQFVLNKDAVGINRNEFVVCMYLTRSGTKKHVPMVAQCYASDAGIENVVVSEITGYPFGFLLYFNPTEISYFEGLDITQFADFRYDDIATVKIPLCIKEVNGVFPLDFRSREEIKHDRK